MSHGRQYSQLEGSFAKTSAILQEAGTIANGDIA